MLKVLEKSYLNLDKKIHDPNFINLANISDDKINFTKETRFLNDEIKNKLNNAQIKKFEKAVYICKYKNKWYLLADLKIEAYKQGHVKAHELTLPDTIQGMASNSHYYNAEAAPILLIYNNPIDFKELMNHLKFSYTFESNEMLVYVIEGSEAQKVLDLMKQNNEYYIADGHHRIYTKSLLQGNNSIMAAFISSQDIIINSITRKIPHVSDEKFNNSLKFLKEQGMLLNEKHELQKGIIKIKRNDDEYFVRLIELDGDAFWNNDVYRFNTQVLSQAFGIFESSKILYEENEFDFENDTVYIYIHPMSVEEFICISKNNSILPPKSTCFQYKFPSFKIFKKI